MTVELEQVAAFARINVAETLLPELLQVAEVMVDEYLGSVGQSRCPEEVRDLSVMLVVRRLWDVRQAQNGLVQYGPDGETSVIPADVMKPAMPMLRRYRGFGAVG